MPKTTSPSPRTRILGHIAEVRAPLEELAATFQYGKIVHQGLTLAIVGRPNVGKSSLFNRLVERERAIVTAQPGTTRDLVSETVAIGGIPVQLVDTAGIRRALDEAESIGIKKSMEALADADLVLVVLDASQPQSLTTTVLLAQVTRSRRHRGPKQIRPLADVATQLGCPAELAPASHLCPYRRRHSRTSRADPPSHHRRHRAHRIHIPHQRPSPQTDHRRPGRTRRRPSAVAPASPTKCFCSISTTPSAPSTKSPAPPPPTTSST